MPTFSCNVKPRAQLTPDSEGKYHLTPEKLNDMANPIVSVNLDIETFAPTVQFTVGNEVNNARQVTLQVMLGGNPLNTRMRLQLWLTQSESTVAVASSLPSTPPAGWVAGQASIITGTDGLYVFTVTHNSTGTWYVAASAPTGVVYVSSAITF